MGFAQDIKKYFSTTKELPPINRIFAYVLFSIGAIAFIASAAVCALMAWGLLLVLYDGWTTYLTLAAYFGVAIGLGYLYEYVYKRFKKKE